MMIRLNEAQVRAAVAANPGKGRRRTLALAADPEWSGPKRLDSPSGDARVVGCRSPLEVREVMLRHDEESDDLLVILTPCSAVDLGLDVRARLIKGDVLRVDPFASVLAMFHASVLDPQLVRERWLLDDLIAIAPNDGWVDPGGGEVLDSERAWRTWEAARLGLTESPRGATEVLSLPHHQQLSDALAGLEPEIRRRLADRWGGSDQRAVAAMVQLLAQDRANELIAWGLVAQVLWAPTADGGLAHNQTVARARLEAVLGRDQLDSVGAAAWGSAAESTLAKHPNPTAVVDVAERILRDADALDLCVLSDSLPTGFEQRLLIIGRMLTKGDVDEATAALAELRKHRVAPRRQHRVAMAEAAIRLLRRGTRSASSESSFSEAVLAYVVEGAWVDEARRLLAEGDRIAEVSAAYAAIADGIEAEQVARSLEFAALLAEWSKSEPVPDPQLLPVERILDEVVATVAEAAPVLCVVCDGMALSVAHVLLRDLSNEGWAPALPKARRRWPIGVAALPTVTDVSRPTLLSGQRTTGGQKEEREGFSGHPALRSVSSAAQPPVLFHKSGLIGPSGTALPDEIREMVADPGQRVVGVVVNAIDDHLSKGDQIRVGWDLLSLRPLTWLLEAAAEAGRLVILTADHGHVLQTPSSVVRQLRGGGERWRTSPPPASADEVEIGGPRVLRGEGKVILPADDRLRYGGYKHGYHGGATPEEVLVPIEVLARRLPDDWVHRPPQEPEWWSGDTLATMSAPPVEVPVRSELPQTSLFEEIASQVIAGEKSWVDELLASPAYQAHSSRVRLPRPLAADRLRGYLETISNNGGVIPLNLLSTLTGEPADTLRMALTLVQRLLNLDGAEVLAVRADGTVELNSQLAAVQFELKD